MSVSRLSNIDALRGIAALLVVWQHSSGMFNKIPEISAKGPFLAEIASSMDVGRIGVVCFFLISGFVIPFSFSTGHGVLRTFAIRRFFRLYPVYWLSIGGAVLVGYLLTARTYDVGTLLANTTMLQKFLGEPHVLGLFWTLQAELIFYVLCSVMFVFGVLLKPAYQLGICIISLLAFCALSVARKKVAFLYGVERELVYIFYALSIMLSGTLLRTVLLRKPSALLYRLLILGPLAVFGLPLFVFTLSLIGVDIVGQPAKFFSGHIVGLLLLLIGFYCLNSSGPFLIWLGGVSYSVYLFHPIAMDIVHWLVRHPVAEFMASLHLSFYMALVTALTLFIASITYNFVERPAIRLGRRLTTARGPDSLAVSSPQ